MTNYHEIFCKAKAKRLQEKDWDHWTCGSGDEGVGKSTLAIWDAIYTSWPDFKRFWKERITYDPEDFLMQTDNAPKGATIILDEGVEAIFKRDFNSNPNKNVIKGSTQLRDRNLNIEILGPHKDLLDSAILRRFKTWFHVEAPGYERGYSEFFSPHPRKFNALKEPFWRLEFEHRFPPLPVRIYEPYRLLKMQKARERMKRYIKETTESREQRETSTDVVLRKVRTSLKSGRNPEELKNSRGNWDWMKIRYYTKSDEIAAKTAAKLLSIEHPNKSSS